MPAAYLFSGRTPGAWSRACAVRPSTWSTIPGPDCYQQPLRRGYASARSTGGAPPGSADDGCQCRTPPSPAAGPLSGPANRSPAVRSQGARPLLGKTLARYSRPPPDRQPESGPPPEAGILRDLR